MKGFNGIFGSCFFCLLFVNGFADEKKQTVLVPSSGESRTVVMTPEQLRGKTLKLDYSEAVFSSSLYWTKNYKSNIELVKEIKLDEEGSFTVVDWADKSKTRKLIYKQLLPNVVVFDRKNTHETKELDTYQMMFLTPTSGIASRLAGCRALFVSNIKVSVVDMEDAGVGEANVDSGKEFAPKWLDGKKIIFDYSKVVRWDSGGIGDGWSGEVDLTDEGVTLLFKWNKSEKGGGVKKEDPVFYYRTNGKTAFITSTPPESLVEILIDQWDGGEDESEYQLTFTSPNEGYAMSVWRSIHPVFFTMFIKFRIVDVDEKTGQEEVGGK